MTHPRVGPEPLLNLGQTPLELRDLPEGQYQVVVERAGFEAALQPIEVIADARSEVYAELRAAKLPADLNFNALPVAGKQFNAGTLLTAQLVDLDLDGVEDLLLAEADGVIRYFPGQLENELELNSKLTAQRQLVFPAEQALALPRLSGASFCVVDWDNDYQQDLVIGAADGSVRIFFNQGESRFSAEGQWLAAVAGSAVPAVADLDGDGDKDLVIGSSDGEVVLLSNQGSDAQPQLGSSQLLVTFAEAAAPSFTDWDADGQRELLIAAEGLLYRANYAAGALSHLSLVTASGADMARVQALDLDAVGGKDLLATTADGQLLFAAGNGTEYVAAFYPAIKEKLLQIERLLADEYPVHLPLVEQMLASLAAKQMGDLEVLAEELMFRLPSGIDVKLLAGELAATLR
jgi:hypothetical protein